MCLLSYWWNRCFAVHTRNINYFDVFHLLPPSDFFLTQNLSSSLPLQLQFYPALLCRYHQYESEDHLGKTKHQGLVASCSGSAGKCPPNWGRKYKDIVRFTTNSKYFLSTHIWGFNLDAIFVQLQVGHKLQISLKVPSCPATYFTSSNQLLCTHRLYSITKKEINE